MTKYIQMLHEQRKVLVGRASSASHCAVVFRRMFKRPWMGLSDNAKAIGAVREIDQKIQQESRHFGALRFKVLGPNR